MFVLCKVKLTCLTWIHSVFIGKVSTLVCNAHLDGFLATVLSLYHNYTAYLLNHVIYNCTYDTAPSKNKTLMIWQLYIEHVLAIYNERFFAFYTNYVTKSDKFHILEWTSKICIGTDKMVGVLKLGTLKRMNSKPMVWSSILVLLALARSNRQGMWALSISITLQQVLRYHTCFMVSSFSSIVNG